MDDRHKYFLSADGHLDPVGDVNQYPSRRFPPPAEERPARARPVQPVVLEQGGDETPRSRLMDNSRGRWGQ